MVEEWSHVWLSAACTSDRQIWSGPLNHGFIVPRHGLLWFVRQRVTRDAAYGQQFAAERLLPARVADSVNVPTLHALVHNDHDQPEFAVFDFIPGKPPSWRDTSVLSELANVLALLHAEESHGLGDLGADLLVQPSDEFLRDLLSVELERLRAPVEMAGEVAFASSRLHELCAPFADERPRLCHGDVHGGNFLSDDRKRLWVLDWEAARHRVAASDFNQIHTGWLSPPEASRLVSLYCAMTERRTDEFLRQISVVKILWHLRTYNFEVLVRRAEATTKMGHLQEAWQLMRGLVSARTERRR